MKMNLKVKAPGPASIITAWLVLATGLIGCSRPENPAGKAASLPEAPVQVQITALKSRPATENVVGTVRPKLSATIEAKVSGRVGRVLVVPGQPVTNGELLVQLDAPEIASRLDQATAALDQAERDWKRAATLLGQQAFSRAEYDAAEARYRMAKGAAAEARAMTRYCDVAAPFHGVVTRKLADVGDLAAPGRPLLQLENPGTLRLEADVPEALIGNLKLGDKLAVQVGAQAPQLEATVAELSPAADANSRTFLVKLDLPDAAGLRSGQFGRVAVPVGEVTSIRVPGAAVVQRGQMEIVFVEVNHHAQLRLVKSGGHVGDEVEVVSGLEAGEHVVTQGASHLTDGQRLTIKP